MRGMKWKGPSDFQIRKRLTECAGGLHGNGWDYAIERLRKGSVCGIFVIENEVHCIFFKTKFTLEEGYQAEET